MSKWQIQIAQELQQAQQIVASKMPQPPLDPAIQKTFEAAMAEIERKKLVDQAENARKDALHQIELQDKTQEQEREQAKPLLEQLQRMADAKMELMQIQREDDRRQFEEMMATQRNDADNRMHQMTELLKNRDDNETALQIASLKEQLANVSSAVSAPVEVPPPDLSPMLKEMQSMLSQIEKSRTDDALGAVVGGLKDVITQLNAPIEFVRDPKSGKALGARKVRQ
jgi:DNA anti-recombination protein RmuC